MNTSAYSADDINREPIPLDLVATQEYLRHLVKTSKDRQQLSLDSRVKYGRLNYFANNPGSSLCIADMQQLMEFLGLAKRPEAA
ncbi:hypothetical protein EJ069_10395 [Mesorhizobium sp. M2A.F.Ca.ET.043.05.1.1]|uniref:hypothetical protein n=1 Tax=Mesorhizobium sp. M2A.F.Ca.ET.043.05.1.1 TaxID=2493671 RepID=UPI000F75E9E8|nr:hypothetical protein [Mesorhizobium sp. M2A.F.Ca.ET.043.05.1.1]AZO15104.1 hypothetical protein EJ069_10395 [Mesorhizobium sp. M2A.F.Ca.ET.043.05.1.1]